MKLLHLTKKKHINSIIKHGLQPSHIENDAHWYVFKKDGLKNRKCIYTWEYENSLCSTDKLIKDMVYCKLFIHPRNRVLNDFYNENNDLVDFSKLGENVYGENEDYLLLEIEKNNTNNIEYNYYHEQIPGENKYSTTHLLKEKYAHCGKDKSLCILNSSVRFNNINIICRIKSRVYKNNTIGINYSKVY